MEKGTFTNHFNLLIFFSMLKTNFLVDFMKNKKSKKELKYFARIKLCKKRKLKFGRI